MLDHLPILTCFYTLPNDDAIPQTELPSYIFIQILPIYCSGYSSSFFCFYAVLSKIPRCWWNSRASRNTNLGWKNLEAVLWSWRWDKIWGGESDGREEWSLEKVAVFKLNLLRHRAVRLSWNKCNELQDCSCHDDDYDDDDDVAGDSMIGLLLLLFPSCPTSWTFKRIADHKPRSLSEINTIFFSTFRT